MLGVIEDLKRLKPIIEKLFEDNIAYLSYWESEAPFHGWLWEKDGRTMKDMATVTNGITNHFIDIYTLILAGLGEKMVDDDENSRK